MTAPNDDPPVADLTTTVPSRGWLDRRIDWRGIRRTLLDREVPSRLNWWHTLGSATLTVFAVQAVTGIVLATYYAPAPDHAYESVQYIQHSVVAGSLLRAMHHWGASAMVVLVLAHMTRVFSMGAYKFPREINWLLGVGLLLLVMAFGFTGYLLPWDQRAYWATQVGTNIAGTAPLIGDFAAKLLKAGSQLGAATLTRFYAFHVLWLPALLGAVVLLHVGLVIRQGIAAPPAMLEDGAPRSTSGTDYQSYYQRAYSASKKGGARFWPDVVGKDVATSLAVVLALLLLALAVGAPLEPPADPTDTAYVPRPEWYFLPFFQLLKLFPGSMESTIAVGVPLLLVAVLIGLPFFDRGSRRNLRRRPAAMVAFSVVTVATTSLLVMAVRDVQPEVAPETGRALSSTERAGRALFRSRCSSCHVVGNQEGGSDGPELTDIGAKHGVEWLHSFVENPTRFHDESEMSPFGPPVLSHQEIEEVARYLSTLRGLPGHEVPPVFHDTFPDLTDARVPASRARP